ncbi:MAG TPA: hypothetical protein VN238_04930, partial [Solirubrobacteraceae bacterium]|nr:hypothetical protein [Solirubrobacteraceae bacterium]
ERAAQAARDALREVQGEQEDLDLPGDEDDSFGKILADAAAELHDRVSGAREHPSVKRATEMLAGIEWLAATLDGKRPADPDGASRHDDERPRR